MDSKIIDGKAIAQKREEALIKKLKGLKKRPRVISILVGNDPSSVLYTQIKKKKAEGLGINFRPMHFAAPASFKKVAGIIKKLNIDKKVNGIMIQLPLPVTFLRKHQTRELVDLIDPKKDVDGLTTNSSFVTAVVRGIITLLEESKVDVKNKDVVVLGAGDLVGKPAAEELEKLGARVVICDSRTKDIVSYTKKADIIVMATGVPHLLTGDMVKTGVVVIDTGAEKVNGKVVGDVDFESVYPKSSKITPVPGGVGPMTVISLMENVVLAISQNHPERW